MVAAALAALLNQLKMHQVVIQIHHFLSKFLAGLLQETADFIELRLSFHNSHDPTAPVSMTTPGASSESQFRKVEFEFHQLVLEP